MNRNLPPSATDMVNDHTNGYHAERAGGPHMFCPACDVRCPECGDPARNRNSCHLAGLLKRDPEALKRYRERMGL